MVDVESQLELWKVLSKASKFQVENGLLAHRD